MRNATRVVLTLCALVPVRATALTDTIALANGDELHGKVLERSDDGVVLEHPQLGRLEIGKEQLLAFRPPDSPKQPVGDGGSLPAPDRPPSVRNPADEAGAADDSGAGGGSDGADRETEAEGTSDEEDEKEKEEKWWDPQAGGLFGTPFLRGWDSRFGMGLSGSQGGFEDTKLNVLLKTGIEGAKRKWIFDGSYFFNVSPRNAGQAEVTTKNQANVLLRRDWLRTKKESWSRAFAFGQSRYQFDEFQPWDHRIGAHAGPGYRLLNDWKTRWLGAFDLSLRAGFGGSYSWGQTDQAQPEVLWGFNLAWRLNSWSTISTDHDFVLDVSNANNFRTVEQFNWDIDLGDKGGFGFRFGYLYNFDTESQGKANDGTYLGSLTYQF